MKFGISLFKELKKKLAIGDVKVLNQKQTMKNIYTIQLATYIIGIVIMLIKLILLRIN